MNVKPTMLKLVISIIVSLIIGLVIKGNYFGGAPLNLWLTAIILSFVIIYLIWSLIQKKR